MDQETINSFEKQIAIIRNAFLSGNIKLTAEKVNILNNWICIKNAEYIEAKYKNFDKEERSNDESL